MEEDTQWGRVRSFKVRFDIPQRDADGDGPYSAAVIWQQYLVVEANEHDIRPDLEEDVAEAPRAIREQKALSRLLRDPGAGRPR